MHKKNFSRRDFIQAGTWAAVGMLSTSIGGCGGGSGASNQIITPESEAYHFHGQRGITAYFQPSDNALYRQLLPAAFQMPDTLQLTVTVVHYYDVTAPLTAYHEGIVTMACKYQGQNGLHIVTMPVNDKAAYDAGSYSGFPKYIADDITLTESNGAWSGQVTHQGRMIMQVSVTSLTAAVTQTPTDLGPTIFTLLPAGVGPQVFVIKPAGNKVVSKKTGTAAVAAHATESWSKLMTDAYLVSAKFEEVTGNWHTTRS